MAHAQVSPVEKLSTKTVAQSIHLCQEGEEALEGSLALVQAPAAAAAREEFITQDYYVPLPMHVRKANRTFVTKFLGSI